MGSTNAEGDSGSSRGTTDDANAASHALHPFPHSLDSVMLRALSQPSGGIETTSIIGDAALELIAGLDQFDLDTARMPMQRSVIDRLAYHHE